MLSVFGDQRNTSEWPVQNQTLVTLGCDKSEVLLMLKEVLEYYATYTQHPKKQYKPEEAYAKLVRRWPDAMFDAYTFPKVRQSFNELLAIN